MYLELVMPGQSENGCQWHIAQSFLLNILPWSTWAQITLPARLRDKCILTNNTGNYQSWIHMLGFALTDVSF